MYYLHNKKLKKSAKKFSGYKSIPIFGSRLRVIFQPLPNQEPTVSGTAEADTFLGVPLCYPHLY